MSEKDEENEINEWLAYEMGWDDGYDEGSNDFSEVERNKAKLRAKGLLVMKVAKKVTKSLPMASARGIRDRGERAFDNINKKPVVEGEVPSGPHPSTPTRRHRKVSLLVAEWRHFRRFLSHKDPHYIMGLRQEQRVVARLKARGWYAFRRRKSRPMHGKLIKEATGGTGGEDVFAFKDGVGVFITCKTSATRVTGPADVNVFGDNNALCARMRALALLYGGLPVFCGRNSRGRDYFVRIDDGHSGGAWSP